MDAISKRRVWKLAIGHFALTIICFLVVFAIASEMSRSGKSGEARFAQVSPPSSHAGLDSVCKLAFVLQPQVGFAVTLDEGRMIYSRVILVASLLAIPIWSYCFGWFLVNFSNWLNHFPVLGKKVF
jgi:hypothetical protein